MKIKKKHKNKTTSTSARICREKPENWTEGFEMPSAHRGETTRRGMMDRCLITGVL